MRLAALDPGTTRYLRPFSAQTSFHKPSVQVRQLPVRCAAQAATQPSRPQASPGHQVSIKGKATAPRRPSSKAPKTPEAGQRLAKVLAAAGIASRRASEDLIIQGRVKVNGALVLVPQTAVNPLADEVRVDNKPLPQKAVKRYIFALNKPKGYLCANSTTESRGSARLVVHLFQDWIDKEWKPNNLSKYAVPPRLFTVGRLDSQSTGLIFVTNDGPWAQSVQHPSSGLTKEYIITVATLPTARQLDAILAGCEVDGGFVAPVSVSRVLEQPTKLRIVVAEGRNREVRTLADNAGLQVSSLKRVRIGGFRLDRDLGLGKFKLLKGHEVRRVTDKSLQS